MKAKHSKIIALTLLTLFLGSLAYNLFFSQSGGVTHQLSRSSLDEEGGYLLVPHSVESEETEKDGEPNEPLPQNAPPVKRAYTKPLPPSPSVDEAKYGFPDVNENKVRDDIEIRIVEEFRGDEAVVESFFADVRIAENALYLAKNGLLDREHVQENMNVGFSVVGCQWFYFKQSEFADSESARENFQLFRDVADEVFINEYHNTPEKIRLDKEWERALHGLGSKSITANDENCRELFRQTEALPI